MIKLARVGSPIVQLVAAVAMSEITVHNCLTQDGIDAGQEVGKTIDRQLEFAVARWRIS